MNRDEPKEGTLWVDGFGSVWTCGGVERGIVRLRRSYRDPGHPGFCEPFDVHCSAPTQLELFWQLYKPAAEQESA